MVAGLCSTGCLFTFLMCIERLSHGRNTVPNKNELQMAGHDAAQDGALFRFESTGGPEETDWDDLPIKTKQNKNCNIDRS